MPFLHNRQARKITVRLKILRLLECPMEGRYLYVKLKWGQSVFGPKQEDKTEISSCVNRSVEWRDTFQYEFSFDVDPVVMVQSMHELDDLRKKYASTCQLHMQVKVAKVWMEETVSRELTCAHQDNEAPYSLARTRKYGHVDVHLMDWALAYGSGRSGMVRYLLDGTKAVSFMEVEVSVSWPGGIPGIEDRKSQRDASITNIETLFDDSKEDLIIDPEVNKFVLLEPEASGDDPSGWRDKMSRGMSKPQDWQKEMCNDDKASSMSIGVS
ncbi:hypothetical protein GUITHDRAFT_122018 [Guillardia theta CCMP2712]|uniref:C2 NT-type domain-containing protein n=1 Tax=Guillardia theta (strain CCMP2712) TaxID=905079 RepID=L1I6F0_GUITC|nr:hypothetical protein GUITHDRAFT_122018 [Guillardia theta CCMP2712]EKX31796.1 hypothetical protein GUITHDRAFT_122018 [Guillardia theta CCMP2712]|eukprot:XP_005818776.1 hypothetical protein GUITHDRAFT_122018 [Guillardia theta CCMP2712]